MTKSILRVLAQYTIHE